MTASMCLLDLVKALCWRLGCRVTCIQGNKESSTYLIPSQRGSPRVQQPLILSHGLSYVSNFPTTPTLLILEYVMIKSFVTKFKGRRKSTFPDLSDDPERRESVDTEFMRPLLPVELYNKNLVLKVERLSQEDYVEHTVPLATMIEVNKDPNISLNYSFAVFKQEFEMEMNVWTGDNMGAADADETDLSENMEYGKLWYEYKGDKVYIADRKTFAVALNRILEVSRASGNEMALFYRVEYLEEKRHREAKEADRRLVEAIFSRSRPTSLHLPGERKDTNEDESRPGTATSSQQSPRTANPRRMGSFPTREGANSPELNLPLSPNQRSITDASGARESVKAILRKAIPKGPESKAEERERFKTLYGEKTRASYKRGGNDKEISEDDIRRMSDADNDLEEGEADVPETIEDDEEDNVDNADKIVAKLQNLTKLKELAQLAAPGDAPDSTARWNECCLMFRVDPKNTGIENKVKIAGLKTSIYQYQALGVYWQMVTARQFGGGFLADDMGLGKTLSFLAYFVVERQLAVLHRNVAKSRLSNDSKHLTEGQDGECPNPPAAGWIACPCSSTSPTSKMALQPGLRMACVPAPVVRQWWKQWTQHVDTTESTLGLRLVVDHPAVFKDHALTIAEVNLSAGAAQSKSRMEPRKAARDRKENDEPKESNDSILLLTTQEGFPKLVKEFSQTAGWTRDPKDNNLWIKNTRQNRCSLIFGIAMIDECHENYFRNAGRGKVLADIPRFNSNVRPFLFGYSGTPISQTPRGIEGVLWAIEKHANVVDESVSWRKLDQICKTFDEQVKSDVQDTPAVDACLTDFKGYLTKFMIRRTAETLWFGHTLVEMKPHIHTDVTLEADASIAEDIRDFEKQFDAERDTLLATLQTTWDNTAPELRRSNIRPTKLAFNARARAHWRSRVLATFPHLLKLASPEVENQLDLTIAETQVFLKAKPAEPNPYKKNLKAIVENSPKCLWLYDFIHKLKAERDLEGNEQKLVIITSFPQVVYILSLFIQRYFPEYKDLLGVVAGKMKPSEKVKIINAFTDTAEDTKAKSYKKEVRILIGLTRSIGVGLQLQKACHIVLMEPDCVFVDELQAYGRVHRIGQRNPLSRSFRLIDDGSDIEKLILKRQEDRKEVAGTKIGELEVEETEKRAVTDKA
ncbi:uncharacterized protein RCO7_09039 [Rhynchosporium graminicola]|uniref:Helicase C-terminal domain-containing protein n=1 Tax=Rhynchosporium graminicola TaxID=2792576 RepID=A0A1E1LPB0_9HELO|nr:uncharacterized protein RCO7_09039 [Rhynchosporium commune]